MRLIDMFLYHLVNATNRHLETASVEMIGTGTVIEGGTEVDLLETPKAGAIEAITSVRKGRKGEGEVPKLIEKVDIPLTKYFVLI
jgi:hypothetical protein